MAVAFLAVAGGQTHAKLPPPPPISTTPRPPARPPTPTAPVTQTAIGTTPDLPVYVKTNSTLVPYISMVGILATVVIAVVGVVWSHRLARDRDRENHQRELVRRDREEYLEGIDLSFGSAVELMAAFNGAIRALGTDGFDMAMETVNTAQLAFSSAGVSLDARTGPNSKIALAFKSLRALAADFLDQGGEHSQMQIDTFETHDSLDALAARFVGLLNEAIDTANSDLHESRDTEGNGRSSVARPGWWLGDWPAEKG